MLKFFCAALFFLAMFNVAKSQESLVIADTAEASAYFSDAKELLKNAKYDSSILIFKELQVFYEKQEMWDKEISCLNHISENHWQSSNLNAAAEAANEALAEIQKHSKSNYLENALALRSLAIVRIYQSKIIRSKELCLEALSLLNKVESDKQSDAIKVQGKVENVLAYTYLYFGQAKPALKLYLKDLNASLNSVNIDSLSLAGTYANIGAVYLSISHHDSALYFLQKGIGIIKAAASDRHPTLADIYYSIAGAYGSIGQFEKALDYALTTLNILKLTSSVNYLEIDCYNVIGRLYAGLKQYNKSIEYFKEGLKMSYPTYENYQAVGHIYTNMGLSYDEMGKDSLALEYFNLGLEKRIEITGSRSRYVGESFAEIGTYYLNRENFDSAKVNFQKALNIFQENFGSSNFNVAANYYNLAEASYREQNYQSALVYFDSALMANQTYINIAPKASKIQLESYINPHFHLVSFHGKARALFKSGELQNSIDNFYFCDSLINKWRKSNLSWEDKTLLAETAETLYENAVHVCMTLFEKTKDISNIKTAYYFNQKSKTAVLSESTSKNNDNEIRFLPDDLKAIEKTIKFDIGYYQSQIREKRIQGDSTSLQKIADYEDELFALGKRKDSIELLIKTKFPEYYGLNYSNETPSIVEVQDLISNNTALIEYISIDSLLYTFLITRDKFEVFTSPIDTTFSNEISDFVEGVSKGPLAKDSNTAFTNYTKSGFKLYNTLLKKPLDYLQADGIDNLLIVPSGKLSYLPFEILLKTDSSSGSYSTLDYLVEDYNISYGYSAKNLFQQSRKNKSSSEKYLGFAPSYEGLQIDYEEHRDLEKFRSTLVDLNWNEFEVESAGKELGGEYFLSNQATETSFKENVENSNIVHLAMHALVDDENPMKSKLVFSQENDSINDGFLHTYELFDLRINPELVVLSACNTGTGELEKGEGIISLAYGFAYAGCPSIISSLWQVNDKSTSVLMNHFYSLLSEGFSKSEALRQAKLKLIQEEGSLYAHPYFWSPFILVGNPEPIDQPTKINWWYVFGLFLSLVLVLGFYRLRRSDSA